MAFLRCQHQPVHSADVVLGQSASADDVHMGQIVLGVRIAKGRRRILEEFARSLGVGVNFAIGNAGETVHSDRDEGAGDCGPVSLIRGVLIVVFNEPVEAAVSFDVVARDDDAVGVYLAEFPARDRLAALCSIG